MGVKKFFRNIKQLFKLDIKRIYKDVEALKTFSTTNSMLNHLLYELSEAKYQMNRPNICDYEATLDKLCSTDASFIRFGDGETAVMSGEGIRFQKPNTSLAKRLRDIVSNQRKDIMIGIDYLLYYPNFNKINDFTRFFYRTSFNSLKQKLDSFIDFNKKYYTTAVTGVYENFESWSFEEWYAKWRSIWNNKKITIICGDRVFNKLQYNIFDNASDIDYLYIPSSDAFDEYDNILDKAKKIEKDRLVILIAGPTAKPLAYDLATLPGGGVQMS